MSTFGVPMAVGAVLGRIEGPKSCGLSGRGFVASPLGGDLVGGEVKRLGASTLVSKAAADGIVNPCTAAASAWQTPRIFLICRGRAAGVMGERRK